MYLLRVISRPYHLKVCSTVESNLVCVRAFLGRRIRPFLLLASKFWLKPIIIINSNIGTHWSSFLCNCLVIKFFSKRCWNAPLMLPIKSISLDNCEYTLSIIYYLYDQHKECINTFRFLFLENLSQINHCWAMRWEKFQGKSCYFLIHIIPPIL